MNAGRPDMPPPPDAGDRRPSPKTPRGRRWTPRRIVFSCCKLTAALVAVIVVAGAILAIRMEQGPIEIGGLGHKIENALHDRFGSKVKFSLGATSVVQRGFGPALAIDKLAVSSPDGEPILTAPKAEITIDPFALMFGRVVPRRLDVFDVTLRLVLLKNGNLAVAAGQGTKPFFEVGRGSDGDAASPDQAPVAPDQAQTPDASPGTSDQPATPQRRAVVMKQASAAIRQFVDTITNPQSVIAAVDRLGISRGTLVIDDQVTNDQTVYKNLELAFDKAHGQTSLGLSAEGPGGRWRVAALASGRPHAERRFDIQADNLSVDELQLAMGSRSLGFETDIPFGVRASIGLRADDTLSEAAGSFKLGSGFFRLDDPDQEPDFITAVDGAFHWNSETRQIMVDPTQYIAGSTHFTLAGQVMPPLNEGEPWRIGFATTGPGMFGPDRRNQQPVPLESAQFAGRLMPDRKKLAIDRLALKVGGGGMALAGQIDWVDGPHIRFGASLDPTPVATLQRMWPAFMAAPVRAWILSHFSGGTVDGGTIRIDYDKDALKRMRADRAPPDSSVSLDFSVSKTHITFLDGVPPIDNVVGIGHITGRTSHFELTSGTINQNGKPLALTDGIFYVGNANHHPTLASVTAHLNGSVEAVTGILSLPPLRPYASMPLDPETLHGKIDGRLDKTLILGGKAEPGQEALRVSAKVTDFKADRLIGKENLEDGTLSIAVDDAGLKATGQGKIFGGPSTFEISRAGMAPPQAVIAVTLDDAARAKLGLSTIPGVNGPMTARVNAVIGDPAKLKAQVDIDLAKTTIAAAYLGLMKPAGKPARVGFNVAQGDEHMTIDGINIDIGPLQAHGMVDLGHDNSFQSAKFSSVKVSPGDDMKVEVSKSDDSFKLTIRGSTIDARPFLKALTSTPTNEATPISRNAKAEKDKVVDNFKGFDIDLKSNLLTGFNKEVMSGVDMKLSRRNGQIRQFNVQGRFGRDSITGTMGNNQRIKLAAQDAGALVSFIDLYKHMEGGGLDATIQWGDDLLDGNLEIRDFVLRDEPALRRLVAQSTEVSAPGQDAAAARRINGSAVGFKRLKVNFHRAGSRLELHDATMYGPEIGLSVDGWLDYSHDKVAMNGTFVPAFAINNLFSQIPVFGIFLGGKSNEGLLAITFRISGLASSPTLSINPLSAIAPGFLRSIFGALDNDGRPLGLAPPPPPPGGEPSR